ncbi:thiol peroxidase [Loktanella sp. 5RATIMAR09]|uniref:peroxiredoxin n=1 Tax=Loktanella sp. 5RATIMAR09 TaxID=1225655 RepID=UPI0006EBABDA|nr:peroxiredoxin [Loktanella sp. 5RATIMAR09]KQI71673.1 thiol peroxidase [Loktanella sp. 5RATIMAR09]
MTIKTGDTLPDATMLVMGDEGPQPVQLSDKVKGRKVVIFGLPGAYTGTCTTAHVPSFMVTYDAFMEKGVDEIICVSVNDPFVMKAWGDSTRAIETGITMLADAESAFTKAIGMNFSAGPVGFVDRSKRYAMLVEDGIVTILNEEEGPGVCEVSAGETLLAQIA